MQAQQGVEKTQGLLGSPGAGAQVWAGAGTASLQVDDAADICDFLPLFIFPVNGPLWSEKGC